MQWERAQPSGETRLVKGCQRVVGWHKQSSLQLRLGGAGTPCWPHPLMSQTWQNQTLDAVIFKKKYCCDHFDQMMPLTPISSLVISTRCLLFWMSYLCLPKCFGFAEVDWFSAVVCFEGFDVALKRY